MTTFGDAMRVTGSRKSLLQAMRRHPAGRAGAIIGEVKETPAGAVVMRSAFGGLQVVDMLVGDQLPRIC